MELKQNTNEVAEQVKTQLISSLNSLQISLKLFYFPVKLFLDFLMFPMAVIIKSAECFPITISFPACPEWSRLFPLSSQRGSAGYHGQTLSFPPSRLFSTRFCGQGMCVGR